MVRIVLFIALLAGQAHAQSTWTTGTIHLDQSGRWSAAQSWSPTVTARLAPRAMSTSALFVELMRLEFEEPTELPPLVGPEPTLTVIRPYWLGNGDSISFDSNQSPEETKRRADHEKALEEWRKARVAATKLRKAAVIAELDRRFPPP